MKNLIVTFITFLFAFLISVPLLASEQQEITIPGEDLFQSPAFTRPQFNPDGSLILALKNSEEWRDLIVIDIATTNSYLVGRFTHDFKINSAAWVDKDTVYIHYVPTAGRDRSIRQGIYHINLSDLSDKPKLNRFKHNGLVLSTLPEQGDKILFAVDKEDEDVKYEIFTLDVNELTNPKIKNAQNMNVRYNDALHYFYDATSNTYFAIALAENESDIQIWYQLENSKKWQLLYQWQHGEFDFVPMAHLGGDEFLVLSNQETDLVSAYKFNAKTQTFTELLYQHAQYDLVDVQYDIERGGLSSVTYIDHGKRSKHYFSDDTNRQLEKLKKIFSGKQIFFSDKNKISKKQIVFVTNSDDPGNYYVYHEEQNKAELIGSHLPHLEGIKLAQSESFSVTNDAGDTIESILTRASVNNNEVLLVMPHGGPIGIRDSDNFLRHIQFLANRGYSILRVNFTGSGGFGKAFQEKGVGQFGQQIENDIALAVNHVKEKYGYGRGCAIGISYGGYSATMLAIKDPNFYQCVVAMYGVYDLPHIFNTSNVRIQDEYREHMATILGEYSEDREFISPLYLSEKLTAPVLLVAGKKDTVAVFEQSNRMKYVLELQNKDVDTVFYRNVGHGHHSWYGDRHQYAYVDHFIRKKLDLPQLDEDVIRDEYKMLARSFNIDRSSFIARDADKALSLYKQGAELGNEYNMHWYAKFYHYASDVEKDLELSVKWYKKSSELGFAESSYELARIYKHGELGEKDPASAFKYFQLAHEQGHNGKALFEMGLAWCTGQGTDKNMEKCLEVMDVVELQNSEEMKDRINQNHLRHFDKLVVDIIYNGRFSTDEREELKTVLAKEYEVTYPKISVEESEYGIWGGNSLSSRYRHLETTTNIPTDFDKRFGIEFDLESNVDDDTRTILFIRWTRTYKDTGKSDVYARQTSTGKIKNLGIHLYKKLPEQDVGRPMDWQLEIMSADQELLYSKKFSFYVQ